MSADQGHTPIPWERLPGTTQKGHPLGEGKVVIRLVQKREPGVTDYTKVAICDGLNAWGDAEYIVRACNVHPQLLEALELLANAEQSYRKMHDIHGDGHKHTGRAWDDMRKAGDRAREALVAAKGEHHAEQ